MRRIILPLAGAIAIALAAPALAQGITERPRIVVTGEGEVALRPDLAIISLTVMREAKTARAALDETNAAMADIIAEMKQAGIAQRDLQTGGLQINPRYHYPNNGAEGEAPRIVAYQVANSLTVRVRDLDALGAIIDRSVTLGVNQGAGIALTNDDPSEALAEARRRAVADAIDKARTLAGAAGVGLGDILEMSEQAHRPQPMPIEARAFRAEAADSAVPIEAGENSYTVTVNVTFAIGG